MIIVIGMEFKIEEIVGSESGSSSGTDDEEDRGAGTKHNPGIPGRPLSMEDSVYRNLEILLDEARVGEVNKRLHSSSDASCCQRILAHVQQLLEGTRRRPLGTKLRTGQFSLRLSMDSPLSCYLSVSSP